MIILGIVILACINQLSIEMNNSWAWWFITCEMHVCWNSLEDLGAESLNSLLYVWKNWTDRKQVFDLKVFEKGEQFVVSWTLMLRQEILQKVKCIKLAICVYVSDVGTFWIG